MTQDAKHGVDFLYDYYAIFEIPRDADHKQITSAWREKSAQYHADRNGHLPESDQLRFQELHLRVNEGYEILRNEDTRIAYDIQLNNWDGYISTSGIQPLIIGGKQSLLFKSEEDIEKYVSDMTKKAAIGFMFDAKAHESLEQLYQTMPDLPPALLELYLGSLRKKEQVLQVEEYARREAIGMPNKIQPFSAEYVSELHELISDRNARLEGELLALQDQHLTDLQQLTSGNTQVSGALEKDSTNALDVMSNLAVQNFERESQRLIAIAEERKQLVNKLLSYVHARYIPDQDEYYNSLVLCVEKDGQMWLSFEVDFSEEGALADMILPPNESEIQQYLAQQKNVLYVELGDLDLQAVIRKVLDDHYDLLQ